MSPERSTGRGILIFLGIIIFLFVVVIGLSLLLGKKQHFGSEKIALIRVEGVITDSKPILEQFDRHSKNPTVKAIVLRVDSPGGGVAPSQEIYQAITNIRAEGKQKIVVSMGSLAASGGYYISCPADKIVANPGTITGSIGVLMEFANVQELFKKVGLEAVVIKSGKHKDIGSPTRPMTKEEKQLLQGVLDDVYQQFVEAIAQGRGMKEEEVRKLADGRIFSGRQALQLGLVDELGGIQEALELAAELSGIEKRPLVVIEDEKGFSLRDLMRSVLQDLMPQSFTHNTVSLQYIWR
jgi:protease-4